jgi:prohibitin 2
VYSSQAQSAKLIGEAVQQNPSFIALRKIEAAREIASTISQSANRVYLPADSLFLNLVSCVCAVVVELSCS